MRRFAWKFVCSALAMCCQSLLAAPATVTQQFSFQTGWSLSGNSLNTAMSTSEWFGTKDQPISGVSSKILSVWQWDAAAANWQFFSPSLTATELASYAKTKGYGVLSSISPGHGFWVNVSDSAGVTLSGTLSGTPAVLTADDLPAAWSLNSVYANSTPRNLNTSSSITPPSPGQTPSSFLTLWAWDAPTTSWYFYAPSLDADGTLATYASSKSYGNFITTDRKLGAGVGFWVNKSASLTDTPPSIFPVGLVVAAPTSVVKPTDVTTQAPTTTVSKHTYLTGLIRDILGAKLTFSSAFRPDQLLASGARPNCFGPSLNYTSHPDSTSSSSSSSSSASSSSSSSSGQLPGGDLGIWQETDGAGSACASVTLNGQMDGVSNMTSTALVALGGLAQQAHAASKMPASGACSDLTTEMNALGVSGLTFSSASLCKAATTKVWTYNLAFSFTGGDAKSHDATLVLTHTAGSTPATYSGSLQWSVTKANPGGNCGSATDVTRLGSLSYQRAGSAAMTNVMRSGQYCGKLTAAARAAEYSTDGQLNPAGTWADDFSRFGAAYDPSNLDGYFGYGWQAGRNDSNTRILSVGINGTTQKGEAWYGFGDAISVSDGSIKGFICSWAAPGSTHFLQTSYAQRQAIQYNSTTSKWESTTGGSNIRYAPTNSCTYSGTGFWYDRDLSQANNESTSDIQVLGTESDFLWKPSGSTTVTDAIKARGMVFPSF